VTSLAPPRQIVIALDQPWRGQLRICLERKGASSTRVSVRAEIDERGVEWLLRRRGWPACQPADDGDYRIGLLTSKSGPGAVFAVACENLAVMAVDELNADGGLHGRRVRLLVSDDATDPATGFRWGERPADQLAVAAGPLMRTSGARHWFLVGDDYSWSHGGPSRGPAGAARRYCACRRSRP